MEIVELSAIDEQSSAEAQNTLYHTAEVELTETTKLLIDAVERMNPTRLAFESLSELRLLSHSALRYRRQLLSFKQYLADRTAPSSCSTTRAPAGAIRTCRVSLTASSRSIRVRRFTAPDAGVSWRKKSA